MPASRTRSADLSRLTGGWPGASMTGFLASVLMLLGAGAAFAATDGALPPKDQWQASASSRQVEALAPRHAIDGDPTTRWGGAFSADHWLQVDLGRPSDIGGAAILWDSGFAVSYSIQTSLDGKAWKVAYTSSDSRGDTDYLFFPTVKARYVRLASLPKTADWGVSVFEFTPFSGRDAARISGLAGRTEGRALFDGSGGSPGTLAAAGDRTGTRRIEISVPPSTPVSGLEVWWGGPRDGATLEARSPDGGWTVIAEDPGTLGQSSFLAARQPLSPSALRLTVGEAGGKSPVIQRLRLLGPKQVLTPTKRYEVAASRAHRDLFPSSLHQQQVYWTVVGIPAGRQKSIFDEYGNVEAFKGAPMVQAAWRDVSGNAAIADGVERRHALREKWMPMPSVEWTPRSGLTVRNEAFAVRHGTQPVTLVRYRVTNDGSQGARGQLSLLVRPLQVNPPWQHGGVSPIRDIRLEGPAERTDVRVNGRLLMASLTPADARGAATFGAHGEGELTPHAAAGTVPDALDAHDEDGLAVGLLRYDVNLAPGAYRDVVVAFPLGDQPRDEQTGALPEAPPLDRAALVGRNGNASAGFDTAARKVAEEWRSRFGELDIRLPDMSLVDTLRAQGAYMLINQTGHAMQPGPRNYNRSFIRDGSATAAALVRMGQAGVAREYLRWYTEHAVHPNGMVSPILNEDGSVNRGFGSDIEYDSQGQYIQLVADIARLDGGPESVRDYLPAVKRAMKFLQELRERTMVPGYMASQPASERFRGILAPSISHEGYSSPTHSYWDDYFGIKGWDDGAWLAEELGDAETAKWAREQGAALRKSMADSIRATIAWKGADFIPASADTGDGDPTSVSIALDPTGAQDVLPQRELKTTFDRYLAEVRARDTPGALYAYTPYELRNMLTYVHLERPADANELLQRFLAQRRPREWLMWPEVVHSRERHPGYIGDMPHTWIGSEYVRAIFGMLMREEGDTLVLLPGVTASWLQGEGVRVGALPTAFGTMRLQASGDASALKVSLAGIRSGTAVHLKWPSRTQPASVHIDGKAVTAFDEDGIRMSTPFRTLEAEWK